MRPQGTPQNLEKRRQQAIFLLQSGQSYRSVAKNLGAALSSVVRWQQIYQREGKKGLRSKPVPGRPGRLSESQKRRLRDLLLTGSQSAGYLTDRWTLKQIGEVIEKNFGVHYCLSNLGKLMQRLR